MRIQLLKVAVLTPLVTGAYPTPLVVAQETHKTTVRATHVRTAPASLDDPIWSRAQAVEIPCVGKEALAGRQAAVATQAVYTEGEIHLRFTWEDSTLSVTKEAWRFDGQSWTHLPGNEDRLALLFEIHRIDQFATRACAVTCHMPEGSATAKGGKFGTARAVEKGDLWHWKAARSDPAGFADDTWLTQISDQAGGRKSDAGKGGDKRNVTEDKSRPLYMKSPDKAPGKHGILLAADAVEIRDNSLFKPGDTITYRMPVAPEGSVADIRALSRHADGRWMLMLSRRLDTGNDDDVAFNPQRKYSFAMAVFDDSGDENSLDSEALSLEFDR